MEDMDTQVHLIDICREPSTAEDAGCVRHWSAVASETCFLSQSQSKATSSVTSMEGSA